MYGIDKKTLLSLRDARVERLQAEHKEIEKQQEEARKEMVRNQIMQR